MKQQPQKKKPISKQAPEDRFTTISVKVSPASLALIEGICARTGLNKNQLAHMVFDVLIRYMDDRHNLTPEVQRLMLLFERLEGWGKTYNFCEPKTQAEVAVGIYLLSDATGSKSGTRAVMVLRPFFGSVKETTNVRDITDTFLKSVHPLLHKRLTEQAASRDCADIVELLNLMLDEQEDDLMTDDIREMFEDCMRADNGRPVEYGQRTKRKMTYDINRMPTFFDRLEGEMKQRHEPPPGMEDALTNDD